MKIRSTVALAAVCIAGLLPTFSTAQSQAWPTKPIRFFVAAGAGSGPDVILRLVGDRLSRKLGQAVIVDNRPGAGGVNGGMAAAKAPADGYNFFLGFGSGIALAPLLYKNLPFNPEKDFVPVVGLGWTPMVYTVHPDTPIKSMDELLATAKAKPDRVSIGFVTNTAGHLATAMLEQQSGVKFLKTFYKSTPEALRDQMGGQITAWCDAISALPSLNDPRVRVLAVASPKRLPDHPNIPTVSESVAGYSFYGWYAVLAPTGTPADVVAKMNNEINEVLAQPEVQQRLKDLSTFGYGGTQGDLRDFMKSEREKMAQAVKAAGIEAQ